MMHTHIFVAISMLNSLVDKINEAERAQSEMDPIEGPGSREWEIIRERIASLEADIRMAVDIPGSLESLEDESNADSPK